MHVSHGYKTEKSKNKFVFWWVFLILLLNAAVVLDLRVRHLLKQETTGTAPPVNLQSSKPAALKQTDTLGYMTSLPILIVKTIKLGMLKPNCLVK